MAVKLQEDLLNPPAGTQGSTITTNRPIAVSGFLLLRGNIMIRVKIPTPWESLVAETMFYGDLSEADFLEKFMALLASDLNFPCQPALEYANVALEEGVIWADVDPDSLPDYFSIKSGYRAIDSSLLELVTEHISGAKAVDKGAINHDAIIAHQPKSEWESEMITAYLWAIIRLVRSSSNNSEGGNPLLARNAVMRRYINDLQNKKDVALTRYEATQFGLGYIDGEGFAAVMSRCHNSLANLYESNPINSKGYNQWEVNKAAQNIVKTATRDLYVVIGHAIADAQKEVACDCENSNQ